MRKVCLFLLASLTLTILLGACSKRDTYADKLKKERKAITNFLVEHDIDVLPEFPEGGIFDENEFFKDENTGVYFRIKTIGTGDTIKLNNQLSLYTDTLNIYLVKNDTLTGNGVNYPSNPMYGYYMRLTYGKENTYVQQNSGERAEYYFKSAGFVLPLRYGLRDKSEVSILVPFSSGSTYQQADYDALYMESLTYYVID